MKRAIVALALLASPALAASKFVDNACSFDGDGLSPVCAASAGAPGPRLNLQTAIAALVPGDTLYIKQGTGTYITNNTGAPNSNYNFGGFHLSVSGTAASPITITHYAGDNPVIANCAVSKADHCGLPTFTMDHLAYNVIDGLTIVGAIYVVVGNHITIQNNSISEGWDNPGSGNWSAVYSSDSGFVTVKNNYIHDIVEFPSSGLQSSAACIKTFRDNDSTFEYNTCKRVNIASDQAGGIDDKDSCQRCEYRYNLIQDINQCIRINSNPNLQRDTSYHHNVCISNSGSFFSIAFAVLSNTQNMQIYNNTFVDFAEGMRDGSSTSALVYNNILHSRTNADGVHFNTGHPSLSDYNSFNAGASRFYWNGGAALSFAAYKSASGLDAHSLGATDCQFVAVTLPYSSSFAYDLHLQGGSPCKNAGRVGGVVGGSTVDLGAYSGGITCVGYGCAAPSAVCGNGAVEAGELCDGTNLNGNSCTTIGGGFTGGTLACNATCDGWNTAGCSTCGNGVREGAELCDGADLGGNDCTTIGGGFTGGTLSCNGSCSAWDTFGCTTTSTGGPTQYPRGGTITGGVIK